jgi:hypothetical protein
VRRPRWYADRAAVTADLEVGAQVHRVSWRNGRLILHDHDLAAEAVLQALGGEPCPCLLVRDAFRWAAAGARLGSPTGWPARWTMLPTARAGRVGKVTAALMGAASPSAPPSSGTARAALTQHLQSLRSDPRFQRLRAEERERVLASMGSHLARAIVPASMAVMLDEAGRVRGSRRERPAEAPGSTPAAEERLQTAALPALEESVRGSQPYLRPDAAIRVGCWKQSAGEWRILDGELTSRGGFVVVSLPVRWLNRVWARGLARVEDHFVLDADAPAPATELSGEAVRWERRLGGHAVPVAARCSITRRAGRWQLAW